MRAVSASACCTVFWWPAAVSSRKHRAGRVRRRYPAAAVPLVLMVALWSGEASGTADDGWRALYRPLRMPRLAAGSRCPVSRVDLSVPFGHFGVAPGIGPGPAYPVGMPRGVLPLAPARNFGSQVWGGQKVLWFVHPRYGGPILIRGRRLDGRGLVRFERGRLPPAELRIPSARGARARPSYTRLCVSGCYAYQIDGKSFSRVVVFRATGLD